MEADFRTILTSNAGLTALVPAASIAYKANDQDVQNPRITFFVVSTTAGDELEQESGYTQSRVQVDLWAGPDADLTLLAIRKAVDDALKHFAGVVGSTQFFGVFRRSRRDQPTETIPGESLPNGRITLDFDVHYLE